MHSQGVAFFLGTKKTTFRVKKHKTRFCTSEQLRMRTKVLLMTFTFSIHKKRLEEPNPMINIIEVMLKTPLSSSEIYVKNIILVQKTEV